jgi:hypothetical protein
LNSLSLISCMSSHCIIHVTVWLCAPRACRVLSCGRGVSVPHTLYMCTYIIAAKDQRPLPLDKDTLPFNHRAIEYHHTKGCCSRFNFWPPLFQEDHGIPRPYGHMMSVCLRCKNTQKQWRAFLYMSIRLGIKNKPHYSLLVLSVSVRL